MTRRKLKVVKFPKPKIADESRFIETLVWLLAQARSGKVTGFAMVYVVDDNAVDARVIEGADVTGECNRLLMLGGIERMKLNFIEREWGDA
jgi:hypothetical protein